MTYDDISSTEFLASLPMVDAKRIGCVGVFDGSLSFVDALGFIG